MTNILTIFLLTYSLTIYGQTCDTVDGKFINCIDYEGLRQGYWELTKKKILVSGYGGLGSKDGCKYFEKAEFYPLANGHYKDGKKIGTWDYYYSGEHLVLLDRKITYYENGSVKDENFPELYSVEVNQDSTIVTGQFYHNLDSININCKMRNCVLTLSDGQELMSFQFNGIDKLEYELLQLKIGMYYREIKMKKNAR